MICEAFCLQLFRKGGSVLLGKTHMAIGIAAALLFLQPDNLQDMVLGSGIAAVGSVISDIDIGTSESHKDANKISALAAAAAAAVVVLDRLWNLGLAQKILQEYTLKAISALSVFAGGSSCLPNILARPSAK